MVRVRGSADDQTIQNRTGPPPSLYHLRPQVERGRARSEFNGLDAQRVSCEVDIASQRAEGWFCPRDRYDDGGFSGGNLDRPALKQPIADIEDGLIDIIVVYKIDRLSRALMDFSRLVGIFDGNGVTFVSVTQSFGTTTSMGRVTLNILLSFCPVRTRGDRRADPRQGGRLAPKGRLDGWAGAIGP